MFMRRKPCAEIESEFDVLIWKVHSLSIPSNRWAFDCVKTTPNALKSKPALTIGSSYHQPPPLLPLPLDTSATASVCIILVILNCELESITRYLRPTLVFMWNSVERESLISVFQEFLVSINKMFILAGRLGTRLSFYGVYTLSWYFLIS